MLSYLFIGQLDEDTMGLVTEARCGMPDLHDRVTSRKKRFVTQGSFFLISQI